MRNDQITWQNKTQKKKSEEENNLIIKIKAK